MASTTALDSDFIVDIQGLVDSDQHFLPKEVAITSVKDNLLGYWLIAPPSKFFELSRSAKITNNWLTLNHHGIEWYEGVVLQEELEDLLRDITKLAKYIFVRGKDKADYLEKVLSRDIVNLEYATPAFKNLPSVKNICVHHIAPTKERFCCAVKNIKKLKRYLVANPKTFYTKDRTTTDGEDTVF